MFTGEETKVLAGCCCAVFYAAVRQSSATGTDDAKKLYKLTKRAESVLGDSLASVDAEAEQRTPTVTD